MNKNKPLQQKYIPSEGQKNQNQNKIYHVVKNLKLTMKQYGVTVTSYVWLSVEATKLSLLKKENFQIESQSNTQFYAIS